MPLTLPSRSLIDALAQRGILGPKQDQIRRDAGLANPRATSMDSAHETVPFDKPIVGFGPSMAMSPAPEQSAPRPSIMDAVQSLRESVGTAPAPYSHRGLDLGMIPQDRLAAGAGNLEGPLFEPPVLPRNYSPAELPEYRRLREPTVIHDPSPIEAALGRRLTASERAPLPMPAPSDRPGSMMRGEFMDVSPRASRGPVTDPFDIEELVSSPEFEEVGVMDFGGSGPSRLFSRNLPERTLDDDIRDALDELGRTGTPQERLGVMLGLKRIEGESDVARTRGESALEIQKMRDELARFQEGEKAKRASAQESRLGEILKLRQDESQWKKDLAEARVDLAKQASLRDNLAQERQTIQLMLNEETDMDKATRLTSTLTTLLGRIRELDSAITKGAPTGGGELTEEEITAIADELPDTLSREEAIAEIEKRTGKKFPASMR